MASLRSLCILLLLHPLLAVILKPSSPRRWDTLSLTFSGPSLSEKAAPNPFTDFRLDVLITHVSSGTKFAVPGFFAADGNAAISSADTGSKWSVRFTPPRLGRYTFVARFLEGKWAAAGDSGSGTSFDGETGEFVVSEGKWKGKDFRAKGRLEYVGQRYWRWSEGGWMLKMGTNSPENLLAFTGFDGVEDGMTLGFKAHERDWRNGNADWGNGKGKGIVGAINYLSSKGVNSIHAILNTVEGDALGGAHPWISMDQRTRYDVSRLEQWELVFQHAQRQGVALHLSFLETENEALFEHDSSLPLESGFAKSRKVYYREIISRFAHHLGIVFILGEENGWDEEVHNGGGHPWGTGNSLEQRRQFTKYIHSIDPYGIPIIVHTYPPMKEEIYGPMLGGAVDVEGASLQMGRKGSTIREVAEWVAKSEKSGVPWVISSDEFGSDKQGGVGGVPLGETLNSGFRGEWAWGTLLAGGGGFEVFVATADQSLDDFRQLEQAWDEFGRARDFVEGFPFWGMTNATRSVVYEGTGIVQALAKEGEIYVIYVGEETDVGVDLRNWEGTFQVRWYSPRARDGGLEKGTVEKVEAGGVRWVGKAKRNSKKDWVVVVARDPAESIGLRGGGQRISRCSAKDLIGTMAVSVGNLSP